MIRGFLAPPQQLIEAEGQHPQKYSRFLDRLPSFLDGVLVLMQQLGKGHQRVSRTMSLHEVRQVQR